jgi:hypothetical protein
MAPNEADAMPFPNEDTTPPVIKIYFVDIGDILGKRIL